MKLGLDTQVRIYNLWSCGWSYKQIAEELGVTRSRIGKHFSKMRKNAEARTRVWNGMMADRALLDEITLVAKLGLQNPKENAEALARICMICETARLPLQCSHAVREQAEGVQP